MGLSGISLGSLLIILVIVLIIFGAKRLRNIGNDLGSAVKSFRQGMQENETEQQKNTKLDAENQDKPKNL